MTIAGNHLSMYTETLHEVSKEHNASPWDSFDGMEAIGEDARNYVAALYSDDTSVPEFNTVVKNLPLDVLHNLTFDQLCKVKFSSLIMLDSTVCELFEKTSPQHFVVNKILSSMWQWGVGGRKSWNNVVDAYNGIRAFDLALDGFEIRLDHTSYYNEIGWSVHSNTYLDGVFAYLVYHKGEHVMTIGFSIMEKRRILIQQVQLKKRQGNRFLFKMPANRLEHIISRFRAAFPGHKLFVVDGGDIARKNIKNYQDAVANRRVTLERAQKRLASLPEALSEDQQRLAESDRCSAARAKEMIKETTAKISHLKGDTKRLREFYANSGKYRQGKSLLVNSLTHYALTT
jgi:cob(I)alamin adenosyltransferase